MDGPLMWDRISLHPFIIFPTPDFPCHRVKQCFDRIEVSQPDHAGCLSIFFQLTVRVADNADTFNLPPDMGDFPLYSVADYTGKSPPDIFPMYQREAMWIHSQSATPLAIKIYLGGANAISDEPVNETLETLMRRLKLMAEYESVQDYVVTLQQLWLGRSSPARSRHHEHARPLHS